MSTSPVPSTLSPRVIIPTVAPGTEEYHILDGMICPISGTLMTDPVIMEDGHSYERSAISQWLQSQQHPIGSCLSPMTGLPLQSAMMIPNHNLRRTIQDLIRRIPTLLLSPKLGRKTGASATASPLPQPNVTRLIVSQLSQQQAVSVQSTSASAVASPIAPSSLDALYVLSSSLGFFGMKSGLIGTAVETPSFIEGKRQFAAGPRGSSTSSRWVDFMLLFATPTATHLGKLEGRIPLFSFQVTQIATAVGGPTFGCVLKNPLAWSAARKVSSLAATDVLMDNLEALVDDCGYYIDGSGWFRQPSGESQQTGWFPGKLKNNDIVSMFLTSNGQFQIDVNDRLVASAKAELPTRESTPAYVWPFLSLNGTVTSVRLVERLWRA